MPVNRGVARVQSIDNLKTKYEHLLIMRDLVMEERQAIMTADLEVLESLMKKVEDAQADIENLQTERLDVADDTRSSEQSAIDIARLQNEIAQMQNENIQLLIGKREAVLRELKIMRTRKDASKAYNVVQERRLKLSEHR